MNPSAARRRSASPVTDNGKNSGELNTLTSISTIQPSPSISSAVRKIYVDCAVQTDPAEFPFWDDLNAPPKRVKRPHMSLTKRLLLRCQRDRRRLDAQQGDGLDVSCKDPNVLQEPLSRGVVQLARHPPPNVDAKTIPDDIEVKAESTSVLSPKLSSFSVPLEKPRPPGQAFNGSDQKAHIVPVQAPPLPSPPQENQISLTPLDSNGICSMDLPDQSPFFHQASEESAIKHDGPTTPGLMSAPSPVVQTSRINHISLPANAAHITNIPQPSPVRKKLSVAEYFKLKTETLPTPDPHSVSSPVLQPSTPKTASKPDVQVPTVAATNSVAHGSNREEGDPPNAGKDPKL